jgi:hypothetical protein
LKKNDSNKLAAGGGFDGNAGGTYDENSTRDEPATETLKHGEDQIEIPFL